MRRSTAAMGEAMSAMPVLELTECRVCHRQWYAFFPLGRDSDEEVECPKCGQYTGKAI